MQHLHLVGFTADHDGLIFSTRRGSKSGGYVATLDDDLLALVREAVRLSSGVDVDFDQEREDARETRAREKRRAGHIHSSLNPKEIQARLRAGRSVSEVADEAGVDHDWVLRFATPVLAEQSQVLAHALQALCHTNRKGASGETLAESVAINMIDRGTPMTDDELAAGWSAYHVRDGSWVIRFRYVSRRRDQVAQWAFDLSDRELVPLNRLGSELGYVEPGRRKRKPSLLDVVAADDRRAGNRPEQVQTPPAEPVRRTRRSGGARMSVASGDGAKRVAKRPAAKKAAAKRSPAKKAASKRAPAKHAAPRKAAAKRPAARQVSANKTAAKKAVAARVAAKKTAAKKTAAKRVAAKRVAATKAQARKVTATPAAAKRAVAKRAVATRVPAKRPARKSVATARTTSTTASTKRVPTNRTAGTRTATPRTLGPRQTQTRPIAATAPVLGRGAATRAVSSARAERPPARAPAAGLVGRAPVSRRSPRVIAEPARIRPPAATDGVRSSPSVPRPVPAAPRPVPEVSAPAALQPRPAPVSEHAPRSASVAASSAPSDQGNGTGTRSDTTRRPRPLVANRRPRTELEGRVLRSPGPMPAPPLEDDGDASFAAGLFIQADRAGTGPDE